MAADKKTSRNSTRNDAGVWVPHMATLTQSVAYSVTTTSAATHSAPLATARTGRTLALPLDAARRRHVASTPPRLRKPPGRKRPAGLFENFIPTTLQANETAPGPAQPFGSK